jgi:hypothetical protein
LVTIYWAFLLYDQSFLGGIRLHYPHNTYPLPLISFLLHDEHSEQTMDEVGVGVPPPVADAPPLVIAGAGTKRKRALPTKRRVNSGTRAKTRSVAAGCLGQRGGNSKKRHEGPAVTPGTRREVKLVISVLGFFPLFD